MGVNIRSHLTNTRSGDSKKTKLELDVAKSTEQEQERPIFCLATLLFLG